MRREGELELELKIERALGSLPGVVIPEDFAARVAAQAKGIRRPLPSDAAAHGAGMGRRVMWVVAVLLLVAILVLAPGAHGTRLWVAFALELDFAALAFGLSWRGLRA